MFYSYVIATIVIHILFFLRRLGIGLSETQLDSGLCQELCSSWARPWARVGAAAEGMEEPPGSAMDQPFGKEMPKEHPKKHADHHGSSWFDFIFFPDALAYSMYL